MDLIMKCGRTTVTDIDNNVYNIVSIGTQCWMKENLRTTRFADGTSIQPGGTSSSSTTPYRYAPIGDDNYVATHGYLYNWPAVMKGASSSSANPSGVQGICPKGWHVPSDAEWTQLTSYVSSQTDYRCNNDSYNNAKALASKTGWIYSDNDACAVGNGRDNNDKTGFSALPAGFYDGSYGYNYSYDFGRYAYFWSATMSSDNNYIYFRDLAYWWANVDRGSYYCYHGLSVRCLRD